MTAVDGSEPYQKPISEERLEMVPTDYNKIKPLLMQMVGYFAKLKPVVQEHFTGDQPHKDHLLVGLENQQTGIVRLAEAYSVYPWVDLSETATSSKDFFTQIGVGLAVNAFLQNKPIEEISVPALGIYFPTVFPADIDRCLKMAPEGYRKVEPLLKQHHRYLKALDQIFVKELTGEEQAAQCFLVRTRCLGLEKLAQVYSHRAVDLSQRTSAELYWSSQAMGLAANYLQKTEDQMETELRGRVAAITGSKTKDKATQQILVNTFLTHFLMNFGQKTSDELSRYPK